MGFRFRKSIKMPGGFRVNLSKSGVGYSWGGNGYRVTKTSRGTTRTTTSIPGTGISYVQESKSPSKETAKKESYSAEKPTKRRSGCLLQVLAIPIVLFIIGVIVGPKDKVDDNKRNNWSVSQPADNSNEQQSNELDHTNSRPDAEDIKEKASSFLSENFQLNLVDLEDKTVRYEIKVTSEGISNREDQSETPDGWDNFQIDFISAQARMSDEIEVRSDRAMLILIDSHDNTLLSARDGRIIDNKYKKEPIDQKTPSQNTTKPTERTVWVTSSGKKYHYSSSCSSMKNPKSISISEAISKGYTACTKCA